MDRTGQDIVVMLLKQMGAVSIKTMPAKITIAKFELDDDFKLTYVFEARRGEGTYLNRVAPYPMLLGQFFGEQDIVDYIAKDIDKFKRAKSSSKFDLFLAMENDMHELNRKMEQLFLNMKTPRADLEKIDHQLKEADRTMDHIAEHSELIGMVEEAGEDKESAGNDASRAAGAADQSSK